MNVYNSMEAYAPIETSTILNQLKDCLSRVNFVGTGYSIAHIDCPQQRIGDNGSALHVVNNMYRTLFKRTSDIISRKDVSETWTPLL